MLFDFILSHVLCPFVSLMVHCVLCELLLAYLIAFNVCMYVSSSIVSQLVSDPIANVFPFNNVS